MKKSVRQVVLAVALLAMTISAGCVPVVVAGAAGYAYYKGTAEKTYAVNLDTAKEGILKTFAALEVDLSSQEGDNFTYQFNGKTDNKTAIEVELKSVDPKRTTVSVRFGIFGNKEKSGRFFAELDKFLPNSN